MTKGVFVTGTDTGVGKTWFSLGLMEALQTKGLSVCGMKPVASGASMRKGRLVNDDASLLSEQSSHQLEPELVNPYIFDSAVAPHIAAASTNNHIDIDHIIECFRKIETLSDFVVAEGAGGWRVPLSDRCLMSDLALALTLPVVLVVAMRLGCLNHALLTAEAIASDGCELLGWVATRVDADFQCYQENTDTLRQRIDRPLIAEIPYMQSRDTDLIATALNHKVLNSLIQNPSA